MASKKWKDLDSVPNVDTEEVLEPGPIIAEQKKVVIVNKLSRPKEVILKDGSAVRLGPFKPRGNKHKSDPIPLAHLAIQREDGKPGHVHKAIKRGVIKLEEVS